MAFACKSHSTRALIHQRTSKKEEIYGVCRAKVEIDLHLFVYFSIVKTWTFANSSRCCLDNWNFVSMKDVVYWCTNPEGKIPTELSGHTFFTFLKTPFNTWCGFYRIEQFMKETLISLK